MLRVVQSLRVRLMALVALALLPLVGLVLYNATEQRREAATYAKAEALRTARLCATNHERLIDGARQLLVSLAQMPQVQQHDIAAATKLFASIAKNFDVYANVGLLDSDGNVLA